MPSPLWSTAAPSSPRVRRLLAGLLAPVVALAAWSLPGSPAAAHAPHDVVSDIDFSADFDTSGVVFAVIRGRLMRSDDRGMSWWEITNGLGGEVQKLRQVDVALSDPDVVYVVTEAGTIARSDDAGLSFRDVAVPDGLSPRKIRVSPVDPDVATVFGDPASLVGTTRDGGATWTVSGGDGEAVFVNDAVYVADGSLLAVTGAGVVHESSDDGGSWERTGAVELHADDERARTIEAFAGDDGGVTVYVGTSTGTLARSLDGGATFTEVGDGLPAEWIRSIGRAETPSGTELWVSVQDSGAHRSTDGGATFVAVGDGLTESVQADQVGAPNWTTVVGAPDGSGTVLLAGFDGLFVHDDGGEGWMPIETLTGYISGLDVSPAYADDDTLVVTTYVRGAFVSEDGGATWRFADGGLLQDSVDEGNRFAPIRRLHGVRFSPTYADDDTIITADWVRLMRSEDRGANWDRIEVGERPPDTALRQFVLAPSPRWAEDDTIFVGTRQGELYRSQQRGDRDTWELLRTFPDRVRSIAPSPAITEDRTIYVSTVGGLYRSRDGGATWDETGVRNKAEVTGREVDYGIQVVVSPDYAEDGTVLAATDAGLFRSVDAGDTWEEVSSPLIPDDALIEAVAFSPEFASDGLVLVSVRAVGLLRSTDGGTTFEEVGRDLTADNLLIADYANPTSSAIRFSPTYGRDGTIYAYAQADLVRSTDAGETWEVVALPGAADVVRWLAEGAPADDATPGTTAGSGTDTGADDTDAGSGVGGAVDDEGDDGVSTGWLVGVGVAAVALLAGGLWATARRRPTSDDDADRDDAQQEAVGAPDEA